MTPKDRITLLRLKRTRHRVPTLRWDPVRQFWAAAEATGKANLFSKVGIGVDAVVFTLYPTELITLDDALLFEGKHHVITRIEREGPTRMVVTTARIGTRDCMARWQPKLAVGEEPERDINGIPIPLPEACIHFPACVTEKWLGYSQQAPQSMLEQTLVLVTPKAVVLPVNALVEVEGIGVCAVQIPHRLDDHKNEYEVHIREEA